MKARRPECKENAEVLAAVTKKAKVADRGILIGACGYAT
jgi:hypothetical protein